MKTAEKIDQTTPADKIRHQIGLAHLAQQAGDPKAGVEKVRLEGILALREEADRHNTFAKPIIEKRDLDRAKRARWDVIEAAEAEAIRLRDDALAKSKIVEATPAGLQDALANAHAPIDSIDRLLHSIKGRVEFTGAEQSHQMMSAQILNELALAGVRVPNVMGDTSARTISQIAQYVANSMISEIRLLRKKEFGDLRPPVVDDLGNVVPETAE